MLGFELEVCLPVTPPGGGTFPGDTDLGRSNVQPVDIETDYRQLPGGAIYSNIEFVSDAVSVIGVNPLAPGLPVVAQLLEVQRIRNAFYGAGAVTLPVACPVGVNYTPVGNTALLDPNNGYFEEAGQPGLGDGLYLQYSIGVPLRSFRLFLNRLRVVAPPELPRARFRLGQALNFANDVVALFQGLPPVPVGYDLRPLHSYLQLAFTQICAMADYLDDPVNEPQIKNCTVVLSRSSLTSVYNLLGPLERGYLQQTLLVPVGNPHNIINRLANYQDLTETPGVHLNFNDNDFRQMGALAPVSLIQYANAAFNGAADINQQRVFGGMLTLAPHPENGIMWIPVEVRTMGAARKTWAQVQADLVNRLCTWALEAEQNA
jgi:hypothetical protein